MPSKSIKLKPLLLWISYGCVVAIALLSTGCTTGSIQENLRVADAWIGQRLSALLGEEDQRRLSRSTQEAARTGKNQQWTGGNRGTRGGAEILRTDRQRSSTSLKTLKGRVEQVPPLEIIASPFKAEKNSNVRGGPGTDYLIVDTIAKGSTVTVIGKVIDASWYLVGDGDVAKGFVYAGLLSRTAISNEDDYHSGTQVNESAEIEEQKVEVERTCRSIQQEIVLADGTAHTELVKACQTPSGWVID